MRIGIVGGGPAGLFLAYLMKKHEPHHQIRIMERDPADATYGWGVVFSDVALSFVRDIDDELYASITEGQEVHDRMQIVHRSTAVSLANNTFHRMARINLLRALRRHCMEQGVSIDFGCKATDVREFADCELIVAADGANSTIRSAYPQYFRPTVDVRPNKLAWYGTTRLFDPLSLVFRENRHGLFIAHAYRFSRTHSTFLVECDPESWVAAGLDEMSEAESLRYCEGVFADDLRGHPLLSNRSAWFNYAIVKNEYWYHDNIVLIGDALRTGHPSIGSGTRLAMQDSIALFRALQRHGDDVPAALKEFETTRRPGSDELQAAAVKSTQWYETVRSKLHLDPVSFAYDYMRRTGRVSHADLRRRDPELASAYEALHPGEVLE